MFYADVPEPMASEIIATLKGQSLKCLVEKTPPTHYTDAWFNDRRAYIRCEEDQVLPATQQDALISGTGVEWIVKEMGGGHSPFLYAPDKLATTFGELATQFALVS